MRSCPKRAGRQRRLSRIGDRNRAILARPREGSLWLIERTSLPTDAFAAVQAPFIASSDAGRLAAAARFMLRGNAQAS